MSKIGPVLLILVLALPTRSVNAAPLPASNYDPPLILWQPPATWSPGGSGLKAYSRAGFNGSAFTDISSPLPYVAISACRQYDSRSFTALANNSPRAIPLGGGSCGIPTQAQAVAVNITVFDITGAAGNGVFKAGETSPPTAAWINYPPTEIQRGNAGVLPVAASAVLYIQVNQGAGHVDFTVDVFGYYSSTPANQANYLSLINNSPDLTLYVRNDSLLCAVGCGIYAQVNDGAAIYGTNAKGSGVVGYSLGAGDGVLGTNRDGSGPGVHGLLDPAAAGGSAVWGEHQATGFFGTGVHGSHAGTGWGVFGEAKGTSGFGAVGVYGLVQSSTSGSYGVVGKSVATAGASYGVYGLSGSFTASSAGVLGSDFAGAVGIGSIFATSGIRGIGQVGVIGISSTSGGGGVIGWKNDLAGNVVNAGQLGGDAPYGVYALGNIGASGIKSFVAPHPTDPTLVINYVALEGPEAGTYFRGRGRFSGQSATIAVPESFRLVTDADGLTIQVTPVGDFAQVAVVSIGLDRIVLKATRDVEFFYTVNGVRSAYRDHQPIAATDEYMPRSEHDRMPLGLSAEAKRWLVANGTYNADGTVNIDTAHRVGWVKVWDERKAAAEAAAAARREAEAHSNLQIPLSR